MPADVSPPASVGSGDCRFTSAAGSGPRPAPRRESVSRSGGAQFGTTGREELRLFGGIFERRRRTSPAGNRLQHLVEVAGADKTLVPDGGIAVIFRESELGVLQIGVSAHSHARVFVGQPEHA